MDDNLSLGGCDAPTFPYRIDWIAFTQAALIGIFFGLIVLLWVQDNERREQLSEINISALCEASGWTPELKELCDDYS